ncbi:MAG: helix-turn-helix transcriptional regulator [Rhodothermales bacterium]
MHLERYIPPTAHPLHPFVQSLFFARSAHARELVLPKCNVDLLFNLGDPVRVEVVARPAAVLMWTRSLVAGLQTGALLSKPQGSIAIFGISLKAATCRAVLPLPLCEITDRVVDGALVSPDLDRVWGWLGEDLRFSRQCRLVLDWLASRLSPPAQADLVHGACRLLDAFPDGRCIDAVLQASAVSPRHLRRLFQHHVGVGPAQYLRLSRFNKALHLMNSPLSLTEIALEALYFDQAHFCRDFKETTGMSPGQYRREAGLAPGHVFYP